MSDSKYTKSCQEFRGVITLAFLNSRQNLIRVLISAENGTLDKFITMILEFVNIDDAFEIPGLNEIVNCHCTKALNIHRRTSGKIDYVALKLRWTIRIDTSNISRVLFALNLLPTCRASITRFNLRDNLTGLVNSYSIADSDVKLINEVLIMQSCSFDLSATEEHRIKYCRWINPAGAPDR